MKTEFRLTTSEYIEIDEVQYSELVDIIKKIGIDQFKSDNYLTEDNAEDLAEEYLQDQIEEEVNDFISDIDIDWVDENIINVIKYNYKEQLDNE